jgi:hypothetical protein
MERQTDPTQIATKAAGDSVWQGSRYQFALRRPPAFAPIMDKFRGKYQVAYEEAFIPFEA